MSRTARDVLGKQLRTMREAAGLSVAMLAEKLKCSRAWIYDVEEGRKNFTIDEYERLLEGCGSSANAALRGLNTSDIPTESHDLYWMLRTILNSGDADLIHGIRINLDAISEKALRLKKKRHPPPRPSQVEAEERGQRTSRKHRVV